MGPLMALGIGIFAGAMFGFSVGLFAGLFVVSIHAPTQGATRDYPTRQFQYIASPHTTKNTTHSAGMSRRGIMAAERETRCCLLAASTKSPAAPIRT